jgi:hypothetical protein
VRDAIATLVSRLISYALEEIASLGLATPWVVEQVSTLCAAWAAKISRWLKALINSLRGIGHYIDDLKNAVSRIICKISDALHGAGSGRPPKRDGLKGTRSPKGEYRSPDLNTPEYQQRLLDLAQDPAHRGKAPGESQIEEARVALEMERRGELPGPIQRADIDNSDPAFQLDRGDFIDATGQHWDIKRVIDIFPPESRDAGQPMPFGLRGRYDGEETEKEIARELRQGQNIVLNTRYLSAAGSADLRHRIAAHPEWLGKVKFL